MNSLRTFMIKRHLVVGLLVMFSVVLGRWFAIPPLQASIVWPALGFAFGFALYYKRDIYSVLSVGYYLGYLISYVLMGEFGFWQIVFQPILITFAAMLPIYLAVKLAEKLDYRPAFDLKNIAHLLLVTFMLILFTTTLGHISYLLTGAMQFSDLQSSFSIWMLGDFFSVFIISVPLYFALHFDPHPLPFFKFTRSELLLYTVFVAFSFVFILGLIPNISFDEHKYIFGVFALAIGFKFPYRTAYMFSLIVIGILAFIRPFSSELDHYALMIDINVFLALMTLIALMIKDYKKRINIDHQHVLDTQKRLDNLVFAMHRLLSFSTEYRNIQDSKIHKQVKTMFNTVLTIFDKADYASVAMVSKKIQFIDAVGYDIKKLNALNLSSQTWTLSLDKPNHLKDAETLIKNDLEDKYAIYTSFAPKIKESIQLAIRLRENVYCTMAFDFDIDSEKTFNSDDLMFFNSLQILFNSYYESERLVTESDAVRNDIILSLLRTLELFDKGLSQHSMDVAIVAETIAKRMDLDTSTIEQVYWAGMVHDIGKLGVDEVVAKKQGKYSYLDYEKMREHVLIGYRVLQQSDVLESVATYVKEHHERYDGSGYPNSLKGNQISLGGAIVGIAEIIATMASANSYTPAYPKERIIAELHTLTDKHFSSAVVNHALHALNDDRLTALFNKNV